MCGFNVIVTWMQSIHTYNLWKKGRGHPDMQPVFTCTGQSQPLALFLYWTSILWSVVSCENSVFADQYCRLRCTTYWGPFLKIVSWPYWSWHQLHGSLACSILGVHFVSNCLEAQKLVCSFEALSFWIFSSNPPPIIKSALLVPRWPTKIWVSQSVIWLHIEKFLPFFLEQL